MGETGAVRLPAALLGVLAVGLTYLLIKELFSKSGLALLTAFLLAISPWHLQFSRVAFESQLGLFLNIFMALFFLKILKKPHLLPLAAFLAGLNFYSYQAEKVFTPLLVLALVFIWRRRLLALPRKYLVLSFLVGILWSNSCAVPIGHT